VRFTKRCAIAALRVRRETQQLLPFAAYTARAWGKCPAVSSIVWVPPPPPVSPPDFKEDVSSMDDCTIQPQGELSLAY